jgi:phosphatidylethanolamine-binding protein (PEBP) family uncharacterized protein
VAVSLIGGPVREQVEELARVALTVWFCLGKQISPPLAWTNVPAGRRELELLVTDAARNNLSHGVLYAIPPADTGAAEAAAPPGAKQGTNGFGPRGYLPPCPFVGLDPHKYVFELFASRKPVARAARFRVGTHALATPTG